MTLGAKDGEVEDASEIVTNTSTGILLWYILIIISTFSNADNPLIWYSTPSTKDMGENDKKLPVSFGLLDSRRHEMVLQQHEHPF